MSNDVSDPFAMPAGKYYSISSHMPVSGRNGCVGGACLLLARNSGTLIRTLRATCAEQEPPHQPRLVGLILRAYRPKIITPF
jgi:hypothetical protein